MDGPSISTHVEFLSELGSAINDFDIKKLQTLITTHAKILGAAACKSAAVACQAILENPTGWSLSDAQKAWLKDSETAYATFAEKEAPADAAMLSTLFQEAAKAKGNSPQTASRLS